MKKRRKELWLEENELKKEIKVDKARKYVIGGWVLVGEVIQKREKSWGEIENRRKWGQKTKLEKKEKTERKKEEGDE